MRPLELVAVALLALGAATRLVPARQRRWWMGAPVAGAWLTLGAHLVIEGDRWPMVPAYILAALFALGGLWGWLRRRAAATTGGGRGKAWRRVAVGIVGLLAVAVAAALPTLFPQIRLPQPSGPHAVGTTGLFLVDRDRPETFTPDPDDRREIAARIWYPAEPVVAGAPVPHLEHATEASRAMTLSTPFPSFMFAHLGRVPTHAHRGAPAAKVGLPFPVVVFNHAYWAGLSQSTALIEELASQGYAAVSVGHAFETPYFVRPDGNVTAFDPQNAEFAARGRERRVEPVQGDERHAGGGDAGFRSEWSVPADSLVNDPD